MVLRWCCKGCVAFPSSSFGVVLPSPLGWRCLLLLFECSVIVCTAFAQLDYSEQAQKAHSSLPSCLGFSMCVPTYPFVRAQPGMPSFVISYITDSATGQLQRWACSYANHHCAGPARPGTHDLCSAVCRVSGRISAPQSQHWGRHSMSGAPGRGFCGVAGIQVWSKETGREERRRGKE